MQKMNEKEGGGVEIIRHAWRDESTRGKNYLKFDESDIGTLESADVLENSKWSHAWRMLGI